MIEIVNRNEKKTILKKKNFAVFYLFQNFLTQNLSDLLKEKRVTGAYFYSFQLDYAAFYLFLYERSSHQ